MELSNTVELIQTFGVLPILVIVIYVLYRQVQKHEVKIDMLQESIIKETKSNAAEVRAIHETTIMAINNLTEAFERVIENSRRKHND